MIQIIPFHSTSDHWAKTLGNTSLQLSTMSTRVLFIKPGYTNFPLTTNIYEYVPLPIFTFTNPAVGCKNNPNTCRLVLVRDVTQNPPTFNENPLCFTLPDQAKTANLFIAAMRGTITWNQISCKETNTNHKNLTGFTSYHNKIWWFLCPCAGSFRKDMKQNKLTDSSPLCNMNTTVQKDNSISILSKNIKAVQAITTTINGSTKKTIVTTKVTGGLLTQKTALTRQREPSIKCNCSTKFFIRCCIQNGMHEVEWYWQHQKHNLFNLHNMTHMQASGPVEDWLSEKV